MTTPNRRPGRASLPFTPTSTEPSSRDRIDSFAEPRSELLRHALDAKRVAQTTPTPTPTEPRQVQSETLRKTISDPWLDNAKDEEDVTKTTPVRRHRRPSEGAMPRMRTQRELQAENDSLKNAQMDLKIRLEALQNQHNKALDRVEEYQGRIEELEQYEDEVFDLRDENSKLIHKVQGMEYELTELRDTHEEILKISEETVAEMEKKEEALQEAAEIILGLEKDKAGLLEEVEQLRKTRVPKLQTEAAYNTDAYVTANEQPGYPARVHSIDESRPSTGYHDSDYYSMPASPHDKISQESMITVSERAKKFINMKQETKQSIKDLTRRLSNASLKQSKKKPEVVPQVPQIPEAYRQPPTTAGPSRTPRRKDSMRRITLSPALVHDPYGSASGSAPQTPTGGLRGHFQTGLSLDTSSRSSRPSSQRSSTTNSPLRGKQSLRGSDPPAAPERHSSRAALTSYSTEHLKVEANVADEARFRVQSKVEDEARSEAGTETTWEIPPSVASTSATTELDPNYRGPWYKGISTWGAGNRPIAPGHGAGGAQRSTSFTETNFLFNPAEDEDQFVEKTRSFGRRQR